MTNNSRIDPKDVIDLATSLSVEERKEFAARIVEAVSATYDGIIEDAISTGVITREEYDTQFKGKYTTELGLDSFTEYLSAAMKVPADEMTVFGTNNPKMLEDRELLQSRFGLPIASIEEFVTMLQSQDTTKH